MAKNTSGFVSGAAIDAARPHVVRASSVILLILSFLSTIVAFHRADWSVFLDMDRLISTRTAGAILLQCWCTGCQWLNRRNKRSFWYWHALGLDVVPTIIGDLPIAVLLIGGFLSLFPFTPTPLGLPWILATWTIVHVIAFPLTVYFAFQNAWLPENRIIKE